MIAVTYKATVGSRLSDADAERIGRFLDVKFGDAPRTPKQVVAAARPKRSPIHEDFPWDDKVAANLFREERARYLLRSIDVVLVNGEERGPTKAYHSVVVKTDAGTEKAYVPAAIVWQRPDLSEQVIEQTIRELDELKARVEEYKELGHLAEAIGRAIEVAAEIAAT